IVVQNYPRVDEFSEPESLRPFQQRGQDVAYVGAISVERGIREMVDAMQHLADSRGARMIIAGEFSESDVKQAVQDKPGWKHVEHLGWCSRAQVHDVLNRSRVGLVTLHPTPSYLVSNPVKLYEYMAAGLPVVASDFPMWRQVVSQADCGILVDPFNPREIAEAVAWLLDNPVEAERMGRRGRQAIHNRLNWGHEVQKLLDLYARYDGVVPAARGKQSQPESAQRAA
ncbi:MAG: glycosyltransferase, partial [Planctomycetaceae bacterium]